LNLKKIYFSSWSSLGDECPRAFASVSWPPFHVYSIFRASEPDHSYEIAMCEKVRINFNVIAITRGNHESFHKPRIFRVHKPKNLRYGSDLSMTGFPIANRDCLWFHASRDVFPSKRLKMDYHRPTLQQVSILPIVRPSIFQDNSWFRLLMPYPETAGNHENFRIESQITENNGWI
jgi:hypothetical protein